MSFFGCSSNNDNPIINGQPPNESSPTNLVGTAISTTKIDLNWVNNSSNIVSFDIYRKYKNLSYKVIGAVSGGVTTYSDVKLLPNTEYTYKVAINNTNNFSNEVSITTNNIVFKNGNGVMDICNNTYPSIIINGQEWTQKNLDVCKYRNGDIIPQVNDKTQWRNLTTGAWCYYLDGDSKYGKLYNWYAVNDSRGLAPQGWHVPSDSEWTILSDYLGGADFAGGKLKESGFVNWNKPNAGATNESGFLAIATPLRYGDGTFTSMDEEKNSAFFWSSTKNDNLTAIYYRLFYGFERFDRSTYGLNSGWSVRCIKN